MGDGLPFVLCTSEYLRSDIPNVGKREGGKRFEKCRSTGSPQKQIEITVS